MLNYQNNKNKKYNKNFSKDSQIKQIMKKIKTNNDIILFIIKLIIYLNLRFLFFMNFFIFKRIFIFQFDNYNN